MTRPIHRTDRAPSRRANDDALPEFRVRRLQKRLVSLGFKSVEVTGSFDASTRGALREFQRKHQLNVTGEFDLPTRKEMRLKLESRGHSVRQVEKALKKEGLLKGPVDGFFDAKTKQAVQKVERQQGWKDDGVVGLRLWNFITGKSFEAKKGGKAAGTGQPDLATDSGGSTGGRVGRYRRAFTTVNINVKNNPVMPQPKVVHDVKKAARQGGLIGWNEIGPDRYVRAIKNLGKDWGHYFPRDGRLRIPNPISWKKTEWEKLDAGFLQTHGGLEKVSPNRYITWVKLKHRDTGRNVVRINTHLVSGAWSDPKPTTGWRRERWRTHIEKLKKMVERFERAGNIVVVGGDFNRDSYKVLGNQVAYDNKLNVATHGKSTLDYVMHTRDRRIEKVRAEVQEGYRSDHDAVVVRYRLKPKKS